jgi:hypothetical protein
MTVVLCGCGALDLDMFRASNISLHDSIVLVSITTPGVKSTPNTHADMPFSWECYASIISPPNRCPNNVEP